MYNIYYAHHQWKYGTQIEQYELDLIKRYFPGDTIFNPATELTECMHLFTSLFDRGFLKWANI